MDKPLLAAWDCPCSLKKDRIGARYLCIGLDPNPRIWVRMGWETLMVRIGFVPLNLIFFPMICWAQCFEVLNQDQSLGSILSFEEKSQEKIRFKSISVFKNKSEHYKKKISVQSDLRYTPISSEYQFWSSGKIIQHQKIEIKDSFVQVKDLLRSSSFWPKPRAFSPGSIFENQLFSFIKFKRKSWLDFPNFFHVKVLDETSGRPGTWDVSRDKKTGDSIFKKTVESFTVSWDKSFELKRIKNQSFGLSLRKCSKKLCLQTVGKLSEDEMKFFEFTEKQKGASLCLNS